MCSQNYNSPFLARLRRDINSLLAEQERRLAPRRRRLTLDRNPVSSSSNSVELSSPISTRLPPRRRSYERTPPAAEKLEVEVMETSKATLGEGHPDTLTSMANLASTYKKQGRWEEAENLEVQVMETRKAKLGEDHPDTLTSMANLAFTWNSSGKTGHAINLLSNCLAKQKHTLGLNHPDTVSTSETLLRWETEKLNIDA